MTLRRQAQLLSYPEKVRSAIAAWETDRAEREAALRRRKVLRAPRRARVARRRQVAAAAGRRLRRAGLGYLLEEV